jgi:hypothetical protein
MGTMLCTPPAGRRSAFSFECPAERFLGVISDASRDADDAEIRGQRHWARRGDVVVLPYGNSHAMGGTAEAECVSIFSILNPPCHTRIARRIFRRYRLGYAVWASVNGRRVNASVPLRPRVIDFDQEEHAIRPQGVRLAEVFVRHSIDDRPGLVAVQDLDDVPRTRAIEFGSSCFVTEIARRGSRLRLRALRDLGEVRNAMRSPCMSTHTGTLCGEPSGQHSRKVTDVGSVEVSADIRRQGAHGLLVSYSRRRFIVPPRQVPLRNGQYQGAFL